VNLRGWGVSCAAFCVFFTAAEFEGNLRNFCYGVALFLVKMLSGPLHSSCVLDAW
jgi:hypothetical protein